MWAYAALKPNGDLGVEASDNEAILSNLLDAPEAAGAPLERVVHYQGFKYYGVRLGRLGRGRPAPGRRGRSGVVAGHEYRHGDRGLRRTQPSDERAVAFPRLANGIPGASL